MSWFKVDDHFYSHQKVLALPRTVRAAAIGTWTLTGTWSAAHQTDGKIPTHMLDELGASTEGAEALVEARLWRRTKAGFQFVNWAQFQPTRAQADAKHASERERVREYRRKKADQEAERTDVQNGSTALPSRPDPTRTTKTDQSSHLPEREAYPQDDDGPVSNPPRSTPPLAAVRAPKHGVDLDAVKRELAHATGRIPSYGNVLEVIGTITSRAKGHLGDPTAYVLASIRDDAFRWQQLLDSRGEAIEAGA